MATVTPKASITIHPVPDEGHKPGHRPPPPPPPIPPPVTINPKPESLDRRIRNLEALGNGVFIGNVLASYMALPGLVGFWPMSSVQRSTGNAYDLSGQGRTLTYNGNPAYTYYNGLVPYIGLDGTGDYLSRTDETDLDITGIETIYTTGAAGLTMGGWFWLSTTGTKPLIAKGTAGAADSSYELFASTGGGGSFRIVNTAAYTTVTLTTAITVGTWCFIASRFTPSAELKIFINSSSGTNTASIPASIANSTAAFTVGAFSGGISPMDGRVSLCFLCANALGDDLISSLFQTSRVLFGV